MDPDSIRVHAPTSIVFLCGGETVKEPAAATTLRDAFYRLTRLGALPEHRIVLAEAESPLTTRAGYTDLLSFESDVAQVVSLILLFAESPGSLAELGAFSGMPTVFPSLMVVIDDYYYSRTSFIRNGPVAFLERHNGEQCIIVLDRREVGISGDTELINLDTKAFSNSIIPFVQDRLRARTRRQKLDPKNGGHAILLVVGLCQELGAATLSELKAFLLRVGLDDARMDNFIFCAEVFDWIRKVKKGNTTFYVAIVQSPAITYQFLSHASNKDKTRWRMDVREYWSKNDRLRMRAIQDSRDWMVKS